MCKISKMHPTLKINSPIFIGTTQAVLDEQAQPATPNKS